MKEGDREEELERKKPVQREAPKDDEASGGKWKERRTLNVEKQRNDGARWRESNEGQRTSDQVVNDGDFFVFFCCLSVEKQVEH